MYFHALSRTSLYSLSTTIADAAPPPLQMAATPFSPFFKACTKVTTIREPEEPIGYAFFFVSARETSPPQKKKRKTTYVTESDGTTFDVDLGPVQTEHPFGRDTHHGKGLVELPEGDLVLGHTGVLEGKRYGEGRSGGEVDGGTSGVGEAFFGVHVSRQV